MEIMSWVVILMGLGVLSGLIGLVLHANPARRWDVAITLMCLIIGTFLFTVFLIANIHVIPCNKIKTENQVCVIKVIPTDKE